jgi:hypothetical protein
MLTFLATLLEFVADTELVLYLAEELEELDKQLRIITRRHIHRSKSRVDRALDSF